MNRVVALIAHVYAPFDRGGVTTYVNDLAHELTNQGWTPFVFHPFTDLSRPDYEVERTEVDGIRVVRVNRHALVAYQEHGDDRMEQIFVSVLHEEGAVAAHFHHLCNSLSPSLIERAWNLGIPSFLTLHDSWTVCYRGHAIDASGQPCSGPESIEKCMSCVGGDNLQIRNALAIVLPLRNASVERALRLCEVVSTPSQYLADVIGRAPWLTGLDVQVRPLGLATGTQRVVSQPTNTLRLGAMANFERRADGLDVKGGEVLVAAARTLVDQPVEFHIYGAADEHFAPLFAAQPNIIQHGSYAPADKPQVLASFDALLITSRIENFSTVAREAQAAGIPVISSNAGGLPEIVHNDVNGLLFDSGDHADLARVIRRLVEESELTSQLASRAQQPLAITDDAKQWAATYELSIPSANLVSNNLRLSVVVSTFNRPELLRRCLDGFTKQSLATDKFEVIVVDDCSEVEVGHIVAEFDGRIDVRYLRHEENKGLGEARNTGIAAATGDILLTFDDDDIPGEHLLAEHLRSHLLFPDEKIAVLGFTGIHPSVHVSNVLWSITQTLQTYFSYRSLPQDVLLPWNCAWGGRASFKTSLLRANPYNVRWMEDMDLAWRLRNEGFGVVYNRKAVQFFADTETVESWSKRMRKHGQAAAKLSRLHNDFDFDQYLNVVDAQAQLTAISGQLGAAQAIVAELDGVTRAQLRANVTEQHGRLVTLENLLDDAYKVVFEYERLSGYFDEQSEAAPVGQSGKKILVCDLIVPAADRASGAQRLRHLLQMMVDAGHQVTFLAVNGENQERYVSELRRAGIEVIASDPERMLKMYGAQIPKPPLDLPRLLSERQFDVAWLSFYYIAEQYLPEIRRYSPNTKIIIDTVDVHFIRERRQAAIAGDSAAAEQSEITRQREQAVYAQADTVIAITEADRSAILGLAPGTDTQIIPNVHDSAASVSPFEARKGLLFVGNFVHPPNADGITWFCNEVWAKVRKALPGIELTVVGNNPPASLNGMPGVNVAGFVPSMVPYLDNARLSIAPLRVGAGMKGKVGEAMAHGLPVVATSVAAEGMHLVNNQNVVLADTADDFAAAIIRAYNDGKLWQTLSDNGRAHIDALYGTELVRKLLSNVIAAAPQVFITVPSWDDATDLRNTIAEYTSNFGPSDAVSLVIGVQGIDVDTATGHVVAILDELGLDPNNIADIEITPWTANAFPSQNGRIATVLSRKSPGE